MDMEYLLNELVEITESLLVLHNYDPSNDIVEETWIRSKTIRDMIAEEIT